jgi:hypothetical protein
LTFNSGRDKDDGQDDRNGKGDDDGDDRKGAPVVGNEGFVAENRESTLNGNQIKLMNYCGEKNHHLLDKRIRNYSINYSRSRLM